MTARTKYCDDTRPRGDAPSSVAGSSTKPNHAGTPDANLRRDDAPNSSTNGRQAADEIQRFVHRTTSACNVSQYLDDASVIEQLARVLS